MSRVAEAIGIVTQRKEMLEEGLVSLGKKKNLSAHSQRVLHVGRSDIRDVIRELKLIDKSNKNKAYAFR